MNIEKNTRLMLRVLVKIYHFYFRDQAKDHPSMKVHVLGDQINPHLNPNIYLVKVSRNVRITVLISNISFVGKDS